MQKVLRFIIYAGINAVILFILFLIGAVIALGAELSVETFFYCALAVSAAYGCTIAILAREASYAIIGLSIAPILLIIYSLIFKSFSINSILFILSMAAAFMIIKTIKRKAKKGSKKNLKSLRRKYEGLQKK